MDEKEWRIILEALEAAKYKIDSYGYYPSYQFKQERLFEVSDVIAKVRMIIKNAKGA